MECPKISDNISNVHPSEEVLKLKGAQNDGQMTSSTSSLTSPVDSGVQLLDSESEIVSLMSMSGLGCDFDSENLKDFKATDGGNSSSDDTLENIQDDFNYKVTLTESKIHQNADTIKLKLNHVMTKSDIDNHNTHLYEAKDGPAILNVQSTSQSYINAQSIKNDIPKNMSDDFNEEIFELEPILINDQKEVPCEYSTDLMNISLTSYELLDYTLQNSKNAPNPVDAMHVSMSEEVNESLTVNLTNENPDFEKSVPPDDQIVFRRQRRKKSKSDTPKKRVSFHEDILNSTKIDDIHINHGFITHESDISVSFFERGFVRKPDVVKGRYSWAAEGDAPYYHKNESEREVKSDIYVNNVRYSSTSSSSSGSISSSIDEENSDDAGIKKTPSQKLPKSSCLKKSNKKYINTNIVEEETNLKKKKSETNLLDTNIFGSLKNIFNFSTSVPLAERGVPEGQEDISVYSSSDTGHERPAIIQKIKEITSEKPKLVPKETANFNQAKTNLKLTRSEGFYPNYPNNQNLPSNIIMCDSNVYEHKGISYSYEYENFQKTFEQQNKPKSSTIYQTLLKELNFFKRREKKAIEKEAKENLEFLNSSTPIKDVKSEEIKEDKKTSKKYASSVTVDFSDNESNWDCNEVSSSNTRHLNSPKRKRNRNQMSHQSSKSENYDADSQSDFTISSAKSLNLRPSSSKSSLINRFLRNVTLKKMIDLKLQKKWKHQKRCMNLYVKGVKLNDGGVNKQLDSQIEREILNVRDKKFSEEEYDTHFLYKFKNDVFRSFSENILKIFPIYSAYTTQGETKPLMVVLSNTTLYITGFKPNHSYCNYFVIPYTELNSVLIGPNAQTIHISNYDNDMQCIVTTGSENLTNDLIGQLEMAMRRDINKPKLLAVKQLSMQDMINLRRAICKQTPVSKDEEYFHYSIVNMQDYNSDVFDTPLGPNKEGPLMFKTNGNDSRWETAYFILKAGILYMLSSPSHRLPMRVLPLINGACQGARRVYNCTRPHTFQVQIGAIILHLAAPDEYVASDWLQALVHAASKSYSHREKLPTHSCSLLMTSDHILMVREAFPCGINSSLVFREEHEPIKGMQALSCASISDIIAFRLPCAEQSWCILEFACREVHESSGDWILYFATNAELEKFISTLEMLWAYHNDQGDCFPISTIPETDNLSKKCVDTYNTIQNAWLSMQMNLKSF